MKTAWLAKTIATMNPDVDDQYGLLTNHAIITEGPKIMAVVPSDKVNEYVRGGEIHTFKDELITPGFIDCHTHLVFGGDRAGEWEERLNGVSYTEIAQRGGGIKSTVNATRAASFDKLYDHSLKRLKAMMAEGVTTVESKSGYGLDMASEKKLLEVTAALKEKNDIDISPTLLAAHSLPVEYAGRSDEYIDLIINEMMPEFWKLGLFEAVDIWTENIGFNLEQTDRLFMAAAKLGIPVKAHAEQLSNIGGSGLVAKYDGLSTDHIEHLDEESIRQLSRARTVATLLPMAFYFLKDTKAPPVDLLRKYQVPMAVSTDFNPGTSPFSSIRMAMNMACTLFGLTPAEAMAGVTRNAAQALGRENRQGQIKLGFEANFAVWDVERPVEIFYELGYNPLKSRIFNGEYKGRQPRR